MTEKDSAESTLPFSKHQLMEALEVLDDYSMFSEFIEHLDSISIFSEQEDELSAEVQMMWYRYCHTKRVLDLLNSYGHTIDRLIDSGRELLDAGDETEICECFPLLNRCLNATLDAFDNASVDNARFILEENNSE